jgi:hypothetical protein
MGAVVAALQMLTGAYAQACVTTFAGSFADGASYLIEVPGNWNRTLLLYSHGYIVLGSPNPAYDVGDPAHPLLPVIGRLCVG